MSPLSMQVAKQFRAVYSGENWTGVDFKHQLDGVTWDQATRQVFSVNTISVLVFHTAYYFRGVTKVLEGNPMQMKDEYSFEHPLIESEEDWQRFLEDTWKDAEHFATLVEQIPDEKWWQTFVHEKYGNYYRNITGIIEHLHYHLGQIVLIKKILAQLGEGAH